MIAGNLFNQSYQFEPDRCTADLKISEVVADTPVIERGKRFVSAIVRNSVGEYTLTLNHVFNTFLGANFVFLDGDAVDGEDFTVKMKTLDLLNKTITIQCFKAGVLTNIGGVAGNDTLLFANFFFGMNSMQMS